LSAGVPAPTPSGKPNATPPKSIDWSEPVSSSIPSALALNEMPLAFQNRVFEVTRSSYGASMNAP
jgi:hypothetical protein